MNYELIDFNDEKIDKELQELMKQIPVPGEISIIYGRSPSFFKALALLGDEHAIIACRDAHNIVGFGGYSVFNAYTSGEHIQRIGYLHGLRFKKEFRNAINIGNGFKFFKDLDAKNDLPFYLTTIIEDNAHALKLLSSRKLHIPYYEDIGRYITYLLPSISKTQSAFSCFSYPSSLTFKMASTSNDKKIVLEFLNSEGRKKLFFPIYDENNLPDCHLWMAFKDNILVGVIGVWDQMSCKQIIVASYSLKWKMIRLLSVVREKMGGSKALPEEGKEFSHAFLSFVTIKNNDPGIFSEFLKGILSQKIYKKYHYLALGFHERDILGTHAEKLAIMTYKSRAFLCSYERALSYLPGNDDIPYLEVGRL